jgi:hypothetical protein
MKPAALLALSLIWASGAHAVDKISMDTFTEDRKGKSQDAVARGAHKKTSDAEVRELGQGSMVIESALNTYVKFNNRVRVPGFISSSPIPQIGRIVGPNTLLSFRMGDNFFVRWSGAPLPKPGDRYSTYTPAVVLQNLENPSQFQIFASPGPATKLPSDFRLAGYFYETTGHMRVQKIKNGLVVCVLEGMSGQVQTGDQLMLRPPLVENITPINSGLQLSASIVSGSPVDRLSTTRRSFLYLNRGSRDGIRVGRVFESIDSVPLDSAIGGPAPELSNGEAIVVHVTDSYSTAMITKQFDVVRIGSLLRTKQEDNPIDHKAPFYDFVEIKASNSPLMPDKSLPEIPSINSLPGATDDTLPEPRKRPSAPVAQLSELDELEQNMKMKSLTPAEKARLDKLSHQEKLGADKDDGDDLSDTPGAPTVENSFKDSKKNAKKPAKKKAKNKNDEEELNNLMMQN